VIDQVSELELGEQTFKVIVIGGGSQAYIGQWIISKEEAGCGAEVEQTYREAICAIHQKKVFTVNTATGSSGFGEVSLNQALWLKQQTRLGIIPLHA